MKLKSLSTMAVAAMAAISLAPAALADAPKMKMTTEIPASITAPAEVETSIGALKYFDGVPDAASVETV
jgi:hypothetical protein